MEKAMAQFLKEMFVNQRSKQPAQTGISKTDRTPGVPISNCFAVLSRIQQLKENETMNKKQFLAVAAFAGILIAAATASTAIAQQPAIAETIAAPITTPFGIYSPYQPPTFRAELGRKEPAITGEFTNVQTPDQFQWDQDFTQAERALLRRANVLVRPEAAGTFAQLYAQADGVPAFITTDAVLHGLRVAINEAELRIQRHYLLPSLRDLMSRFSAAMTGQLDRARNTPAYEATRRTLAWAQTASRLLDPNFSPDPRVESMVQEQAEQIEQGSSPAQSPIIPGVRVNPSNFLPAQQQLDAESARYFRAVAWLSTIGIEISPEADLLQVRMVMIASRTLEALQESGSAASFNDLSDLLAFFCGRADHEVTPQMVGGALRGFYGSYGFASAGTGTDAEVRQFAEYFAEQTPSQLQGRAYQFHFLPGPQSVHGALVAQGKLGEFGTALVAGLAGEENSFAGMFLRRAPEHWTQDVSWVTLYTLQSYVDGGEFGEGFPRFMRADAYRTRLRLSALGGWSDFQHTSTLLPASTAVAARQTINTAQKASTERGYVELQPRTWGRIASMARYLRSGLVEGRFGDLLGTQLANKLRDIENASAAMMRIAALRLADQPLTAAQQELVATMPERIAAYETFTDASLQPQGMPIAAGVGVGGKNLRVANGHPLAIYVIVPNDDDAEQPLVLARGAIYSYFETTASAEQWVDAITGHDAAPQAPEWVGGLVAPGANFAQDAAAFRTVGGSLRSVAPSYEPTLAERRNTPATAQVELESNVVRRGAGELWFTIQAPRMNGSTIAVAVVDASGRVIYRSSEIRIENGQRFDMVPLENITNGNYFLRVMDSDNRTIGSGRFMVVR